MSYKPLWINKLFGIFYMGFIGLTSIGFFCLACLIRGITFFIDRRKIVSNLFSAFWASFYIWCMPAWSVRIIGREKLSMAKNYVMVANHQSQLDILVLYRLFYPFRWVSKAEVFGLPIIGWNMVLNGYIRLKRGDKDSVRQMMGHCRRLLNENVSVFFFPEGTRSKDGQLKPFKPGAFILARETLTPIQPIVINHTKDALPKHSFALERGKPMEVKVLDEIPVEKFKDLEPDQIADMVKAVMAPHVKA